VISPSLKQFLALTLIILLYSIFRLQYFCSIFFVSIIRINLLIDCVNIALIFGSPLFSWSSMLNFILSNNSIIWVTCTEASCVNLDGTSISLWIILYTFLLSITILKFPYSMWHPFCSIIAMKSSMLLPCFIL